MLIPLLLCPLLAAAPSADEIVARVAANQDRASELRKQFTYTQRVHVESRFTNGKLAREETAIYAVAPDPDPKASVRKLITLTGRCWRKGRYVDFTAHEETKGDGLDESLTQSFRNEFVDDFPLRTEDQKKYHFEFLGERDVRGRKAWRIGFGPNRQGEIGWAGEALIDQQDLQPVNVFTRLSRRLPFAVRTLLGTNLPGIGYNLDYQRLEDGLWLPSAYGAEFTFRIFFFLNREIILSSENSGFHRVPAK